MKNRSIIFSLCACSLLAIFAFTDNSKATKDPLALSPVVAKSVTTPTGTLISCNLKSLKDTVDIPLSYLTEELQVVQLDNRDEALVGGWVRTTVSDNYILVSNNKQTPYNFSPVTANISPTLAPMARDRTNTVIHTLNS